MAYLLNTPMHLFSAEFKINREKILLFFPQSFPVIYFQFPLYFFFVCALLLLSYFILGICRLDRGCYPIPGLSVYLWLFLSSFLWWIFFFVLEKQKQLSAWTSFTRVNYPMIYCYKLQRGHFILFSSRAVRHLAPRILEHNQKKKKKKQGPRIKRQPPPDYPNCPARLLTSIRLGCKKTLWLRARAHCWPFF